MYPLATLSVCTLFSLCMGAIIHDVTPQQWNSLNESVNGHLHAAAPFSRPCFVNVTPGISGRHDLSECKMIMQGYANKTLRSNSFGAYMNTEWETCQTTSSQCLLDSSNPMDPLAFIPPETCAQGSVPSFYIDVHEPNDVQQALQFATSHGIRLIVKNTGHDYKGRSSAADSLALWVHNLQNVSYNPSFIPVGRSEDEAIPAVTHGAGVSWGTLYDFADINNITLLGGADRSVSAGGGYVMGGGHGAFSNALGLGVDHVLEMKVVTPTGEYVSVSAYEYPDLFFALRGGGGGTFGVVLGVTIRAFPAMTFPAVDVRFNGTDENQRKMLGFVIENSLEYATAGWGGYITPRAAVLYINPFLNMSQAEESMAPLRQFVTETLGGTFDLSLQPSFLSFFNRFLLNTGVPAGLSFITTSRLIPADNFRSPTSQAQLLDNLIPVLDNAALPVIFVVAPYLFQDDGRTSVTEAWRNSLWHVTASTFWEFNTTIEQKRSIYANMTASMDRLRRISPFSGAYQNEADVHEPNYTQSFWGTNYARLVEIKRKYDPNHIFDCWQCVNWRGPQDTRFSCYI